MKCRHCKASLNIIFADLGVAPPSNSYLTSQKMQEREIFYPLRIMVCRECWLVQTEDFAKREEFFSPDYSYFSSFSKSWLTHAREYVHEMVSRFDLNAGSLVVEVASNDGYLLQYVQELGISCLGIEPTRSTAFEASNRGIPTLCEFFGVEIAASLAKQGKFADLMPANNVLAHVPDMNDFLAGIRIMLKDSGVATFEFPHLMQLVNKTQFDTIYHEHYSYLSLLAVEKICNANGLEVFDAEEIPTHGGSLRVFAQKKKVGLRRIEGRVFELRQKENISGMATEEYYEGFQKKINISKNAMLNFLLQKQGKKIVGYGAAAKGNTFLNYAGIRSDLCSFVVDKNPHKQNKFLPGSRIPILDESFLREFKPDFVIIFPWNLKREISEQLSYIKDWGGKFVVAIPSLEIF